MQDPTPMALTLLTIWLVIDWINRIKCLLSAIHLKQKHTIIINWIDWKNHLNSELSAKHSKQKNKRVNKIPDWLVNPRTFMNRIYHVYANPNHNTEAFDKELTRAATFLLFHHNTPSRIQAYISAGFHYDLCNDELVCHICDAKFHDWQDNGNITLRHAAHCKFRTDNDEGAVGGGCMEVVQERSVVTETVQDPTVRVAQPVQPVNDVPPSLLISSSGALSYNIPIEGIFVNRQTINTTGRETTTIDDELGACGSSLTETIPALHTGNMTVGNSSQVFIEPQDDINLHGDHANFRDRPAVLMIMSLGYELGVIQRVFDELCAESGTREPSAKEILQRIFDEEYKAELWEENRRLKDRKTCKVCLDSCIGIAFLRCGHVVCRHCGNIVNKCPICRAPIENLQCIHFNK